MANFIKTVGKGFAAPSPSSLTFTITNSVTANQGDILVIVSYGNTVGVSVSSVTDSQSNTYALDYAIPTGSTGARGLEYWRCTNPAAMTGGTDTITITMTGGTSDHGINGIADLYVHMGAASVTNYHYTTPGATTSVVSITPAVGDIEAVAAGAFNAGVTTETVGSPFTAATDNHQTATTSISTMSAYYDNPPNSSITATFTETTTGHTSVAAIVTYPNATVNVSGADTGSGADTASVNTGAKPSGADTGTGVDTASVNTGATKAGADTGSGADTASVNTGAQVSAADTGTGVDTASVFVVPPGPHVDSTWLAARAGLPNDANGLNKSAQIGQFLASHGITPVYQGAQIVLPQGNPSLAGASMTEWDFDQPFVMPAGATAIGRVTLPIQAIGVGADVLVSLHADSGGAPGTLITQTRLPKSWLYQLTAPNGLGNNSPELATAANNTMICGPVTQTAWSQAAVSLNGAGNFGSIVSSGNYAIICGGYDTVTNAAVATVVTVQYQGNGVVANPVAQPSLPQAAWGGMSAVTSDTIVQCGGINGASFLKTVWTATWDPNTGTVGAWTAQAALPNPWVQGGMAAWSHFVYIASGNQSDNPATAIQSVYYADATNGQIQSWLTAPPLPQALNNAYVAVVGNWLIVAGGSNSAGTPVTTCYYSAIRPDGSLAGWQVGPSLPESNYMYTCGANLAVLGNTMVLMSGTTISAVVDDMPMLMFTEDGPAPAWTHQLPIYWGDSLVAYFPSSNGTWQVFALGTTSYDVGTLSPVPLISVPLPATGLTSLATYHIVLHQIGADLNDYVQGLFVENALPTATRVSNPGSGGPWTGLTNGYALPMGVWDQTPGGKFYHTVEDSGDRITSLITAGATGQLLGLCEATAFADGSLLAAVSQIDYSGAEPIGVTQLA